jgi:hypothetical protein
VHALKNVTKKLPERLHRELKAHYWRILDEAGSVADARAGLLALVADYGAAYPSAMAVIERELDALVCHLRFPASTASGSAARTSWQPADSSTKPNRGGRSLVFYNGNRSRATPEQFHPDDGTPPLAEPGGAATPSEASATVSTYSQEMKARPGFAVAEAVELQVLLLDEVHEALDHESRDFLDSRAHAMIEASGVLVAAGHDHPMLKRLCTRAIYLENGLVRADGPFEEVQSDDLQAVEADEREWR